MNKYFRIITLLAIFLGLLNMPGFAFGETLNGEIKILNNQISTQKSELDNVRDQQKKFQELIYQKGKEKNSLVNQLSILDNRMAKAELDIEETSLEVSQAALEIRKTNIDIENKNREIELEKGHISNLLKLLYKQNTATTLEILLLNSSLNDFLNQMKYLEDTNEEIANSLDDLRSGKFKLEREKDNLKNEQNRLVELKEKLEKDKIQLVYQQRNKSFLLEETKDSEKQYQSLLSEAKAEQAQAEAEILALERKLRDKMAQNSTDKLEFNTDGLSWPVPKNYITSGFHDPDYPFRNVIGEHPAIDIRAGQGTTLRAAAAGYVAKVKFTSGSSRYGYIMIIHGDGMSTVYGHISGVNVKADQYVVQGQIIGKTGGFPGTSGAGRFSTGPHLHFEVRKNGIPVNPLEYLP